MKKTLILLQLFLNFQLNSQELIEEYPPINIKTVFHQCHSYICFDNKFFIHDPDCHCDSRWKSITKDNHGNIINQTEHVRIPVSHYD